MSGTGVRLAPRLRVVLDGVPNRTLTRDLQAVTVHATEGQAAARLVIAGHGLSETDVVLGQTALALDVDDRRKRRAEAPRRFTILDAATRNPCCPGGGCLGRP